MREVSGHRRLERVPGAHDGAEVGAGAGLRLHERADRAVVGDQLLEHGVRAARERLLLALHQPHRLERIARGARGQHLRADQHRGDRGEPEAQAPGDAEQRRMRAPPGRRRGTGNRRGGRQFALHLSACDISRNQNDAALIQCWNVRASCAPLPGGFRGRHRINAAKTAVAPRRSGRTGCRRAGAGGRGAMRSMSYTRGLDEGRREA